MDLSTIKEKLKSAKYEDGWGYVEDVWLMFENAWLYNKKTTRVYKYCSKLAEVFKSIIDDPMKKLGYCCGQYYKLQPKVLFCSLKEGCVIKKFTSYWSYEDRYYVCKKCFSGVEGTTVVFQKSDEAMSLNKGDFVEKFNGELKKEPIVKCFYCGISCHKICVLFSEDIWKEGFLCKYCLTNFKKVRLPNKFTSENLQKTELGLYIEDRVNNFLNDKGCSSGVIVRLVCNAEKNVEVKNNAKVKYVETGIWPEKFPYKAKTILAFQKVEGKDLCFFAMFVQEYGSECPHPNTRRLYISYLDSVHFFSPKEFRTSVYYEIILGYLHFMRNLGYTTAHLWSCPPKEGEDYVFYCHPKEQKIPSVRQLIDWYKLMLDKGIREGVIKEYKDIYTQSIADDLKSVSELPYFDGDFLPVTLESEISRLEGRNRNHFSCSKRKKPALSEVKKQNETNLNESIDKSSMPKGRKSKRKKSTELFSHPSVGDPLTRKMLLFFKKHREVFLVIHLNHNLCISQLPPITDPNPLISSGIMSIREVFQDYCREKDYEYSSLRRALYSSMILLYELHTENVNIICCNHCKKNIETGYHCIDCKDFGLCSTCYNLVEHDHKMDHLASYASILDRRHLVGLKALSHLSRCNDANCRFPWCKKLKNLLEHSYRCPNGLKCKVFVTCLHLVSRHSLYCMNNNCLIHCCEKFKISFTKKPENKHFFRDCSICEVLQGIKNSKERKLLESQDSNKSQFSNDIKKLPAFSCSPENGIKSGFSFSPNIYQSNQGTSAVYDQNFNTNNFALNDNANISSAGSSNTPHLMNAFNSNHCTSNLINPQFNCEIPNSQQCDKPVSFPGKYDARRYFTLEDPSKKRS